jgi:hypothetical protein
LSSELKGPFQKKYTEPKIFPANHDLKKVWFVSFRFFNPATGKMREFQYRDDINSFNTIAAERMRRARVVAKSLKELLHEG